MALNWPMIAIMLGSQLIPMLFGKNQPTPTTTATTTTTPRKGYQSPMLGLADPLMFDTLLRNMQAYSGFGGVGGASPYINSILELIKGQMPQILGQASGGWPEGKSLMDSRGGDPATWMSRARQYGGT